MYKIVEAHEIAPDVKLFEIDHPQIAKKQKPGQFVIVRISENGERVPFTIAGSDPEKGTITLIIQGIGKTSREMNMLNTGDYILDIAGPLGKPSKIENFGTAIVIGGGVGTAIAFPTIKALKKAGNKVIAIIGAKSDKHLILEREVGEYADALYITTDDGSKGLKGYVTAKLQELLDTGTNIDFVLAIGTIPMMKAVSEMTRPHKIETVVSLNPVMVDGTGMCGGCRVTVDNKTFFACVDGPEFDAHLVDFDTLQKRNHQFDKQEAMALENHEHHNCRIGLGN